MKYWVPSGVFLAAGDYLSLALFLRGQVVSCRRQRPSAHLSLGGVGTGAALGEGGRDRSDAVSV